VHSQFSYWHSDNNLFSRELFYELSPELLLFRDGVMRLNRHLRHKEAACSNTDQTRGGGIFLDLPLKSRKASDVCAAPLWRPLCRRVVLALAKHLMLHNQTLVHSSLLECPASRPNAMYEAAIAVNATSPNATVQELKGALTGMCPRARLKVLQVTQCLVAHAERVHRTVNSVGCNELIRQALHRLSGLSHVFFSDALTFSLDHVLAMAQRVNHGQQHNTGNVYANIGHRRVSFTITEIEPLNQCSLRFYGSAFSEYTARLPHFGLLRELDLPHVRLSEQFLAVTSAEIEMSAGESAKTSEPNAVRAFSGSG